MIAFGFVIEKFDLFALTLANATYLDASGRLQLERLSGRLAEGGGRVFTIVGVIFIVVATIRVATIRFVRTGQLLDDQAIHSPSILPDLTFSVVLAGLLIVLSAYPVVG